MISVIMTIYNTDYEKLKESLMSVFNQDFTDYELVIINDGSTDTEIRKILTKFESEWLNYKPQQDILIIETANNGHSEARNIGIENCRGEYVFFVDSDDAIMDDTLSHLYNNLIKTDSEISIGYCYRAPKQRKIFSKPEHVNKVDNIEALGILCDIGGIWGKHNPVQLSFCATWNKIFKKSLFYENGKWKIKFPTGHVRDDNFTAHKLLFYAKGIVFSSKITYFYRMGGLIADRNLYKNKDLILAHEDRISFFNSIVTLGRRSNKILFCSIKMWEILWYLYTLEKTYLTMNDKDIYDKVVKVYNDCEDSLDRFGNAGNMIRKLYKDCRSREKK